MDRRRADRREGERRQGDRRRLWEFDRVRNTVSAWEAFDADRAEKSRGRRFLRRRKTT